MKHFGITCDLSLWSPASRCDLMPLPIWPLTCSLSPQTFLVLGKGKVIHRFNAHKACYLFSPVNPLRTLAIKILTSSYLLFFFLLFLFVRLESFYLEVSLNLCTFFSSLIFVTLLVNFVFLVGLSGFSFVNRNVEWVHTLSFLFRRPCWFIHAWKRLFFLQHFNSLKLKSQLFLLLIKTMKLKSCSTSQHF